MPSHQRIYRTSALYLNFRTNSENKKILSHYSKILNMTETQLLNRMISTFREIDANMLSCILMKGSEDFE